MLELNSDVGILKFNFFFICAYVGLAEMLCTCMCIYIGLRVWFTIC